LCFWEEGKKALKLMAGSEAIEIEKKLFITERQLSAQILQHSNTAVSTAQ
jgi:hypothetical protein